jgi:uncharacterized protein YaaQ
VDICIDHRTSKASKLLEFCRLYGDPWPIWMRLIIFKTYIRPSLEYGLGLLFKLVRKKDFTRFTKMKEIYEYSLSWVSGISKRFINTSCFLLGIESFQLRCENLSCMLTKNLIECGTENHVRAFSKIIFNNIQLNELSNKLWNNNLYNVWKLEKTSSVKNLKSGITTFLKEVSIEKLKKKLPVISKNVTDNMRRPKKIGPINIIFHIPSSDSKLLIQWIANTFCARFRCICGRTFTKGHFDPCMNAVTKISPMIIDSLLKDQNLCDAIKMLKQLILILDHSSPFSPPNP